MKCVFGTKEKCFFCSIKKFYRLSKLELRKQKQKTPKLLTQKNCVQKTGARLTQNVLIDVKKFHSALFYIIFISF